MPRVTSVCVCVCGYERQKGPFIPAVFIASNFFHSVNISLQQVRRYYQRNENCRRHERKDIYSDVQGNEVFLSERV